MQRSTERLLALAMLVVGIVCFAKPRDSGAGNQLGGCDGRGRYGR
ncbi:hypothetical protein [Mesorhizobium atlanticum]|nr:hypothetical protein [Mesorhizobium atlanticum]